MSGRSLFEASDTTDLPAAYTSLKNKHDQLEAKYQKVCQESHSCSRDLEVAKKNIDHISGELEAVVKDLECKRQAEAEHVQSIQVLQVKNAHCNSDIRQLQMERDQMKKCIESLTERLKLQKHDAVSKSYSIETVPPMPDVSIQHLDEIAELKKQLLASKVALTQLTENLANQKERYDALLSNYECKKEENEELSDLLAAAHEKCAMLSSEIQGMRSNLDGDEDKKGNSLFGEVADQRKQAMKAIATIKARYNALKAEHQNCPAHIRKLRNQQAQLAIQLKQWMGTMESTENSYIKSLQQQNSQMHSELQQTYERNTCLERQVFSNSQTWPNTMIDYFTEEMDKLRARLLECLTSHRLAEDEHLWNTKEMCQLRKQLACMNLECSNYKLETNFNCNDSSPDTLSKDGELKVAISHESSCNGFKQTCSAVGMQETAEGPLDNAEILSSAEDSIEGDVLRSDTPGGSNLPALTTSMTFDRKAEDDGQCQIQSNRATVNRYQDAETVAMATKSSICGTSGETNKEISALPKDSIVIKRFQITHR